MAYASPENRAKLAELADTTLLDIAEHVLELEARIEELEESNAELEAEAMRLHGELEDKS